VRTGRANPAPEPAPEPAPRPAQVYPKVNLEMGPTFVHKNMRYDEMNEAEKFDQYHDGKGRGYASYNKPYSVMAWLEQTHVEEEMVLMTETPTIT